MRLIVAFVVLALFLTACAPSSAPAQQQNVAPVRIGVLTAMTGPGATFGTPFMIGAQKAVDELKAQGVSVELVQEDNKNDPKEAVTAYHALQLKQPDIIISTFSGSSVAVAPLAQDDKTFLVTTLSYTDLTSKYSNVYHYYFTPADEAKATVARMTSEGVKTIGVLEIDTEYGINVAKAVAAEAASNNISVVDEEKFASTETDVRAQLLKLKSSGADAIFIVTLVPQGVFKQVAEADLPMQVYTNAVPVMLGQASDPIYKGVFLTTPSIKTPGTAEQLAFTQKFGDASGYAAFGYDTVQLIVAARTHKTDTNSWRDAFAITDFKGLIGGKSRGDVGISVPVTSVKNE